MSSLPSLSSSVANVFLPSRFLQYSRHSLPTPDLSRSKRRRVRVLVLSASGLYTLNAAPGTPADRLLPAADLPTRAMLRKDKRYHSGRQIHTGDLGSSHRLGLKKSNYIAQNRERKVKG